MPDAAIVLPSSDHIMGDMGRNNVILLYPRDSGGFIPRKRPMLSMTK